MTCPSFCGSATRSTTPLIVSFTFFLYSPSPLAVGDISHLSAPNLGRVLPNNLKIRATILPLRTLVGVMIIAFALHSHTTKTVITLPPTLTNSVPTKPQILPSDTNGILASQISRVSVPSSLGRRSANAGARDGCSLKTQTRRSIEETGVCEHVPNWNQNQNYCYDHFFNQNPSPLPQLSTTFVAQTQRTKNRLARPSCRLY